MGYAWNRIHYVVFLMVSHLTASKNECQPNQAVTFLCIGFIITGAKHVLTSMENTLGAQQPTEKTKYGTSDFGYKMSTAHKYSLKQRNSAWEFCLIIKCMLSHHYNYTYNICRRIFKYPTRQHELSSMRRIYGVGNSKFSVNLRTFII